MNADYSNRKAIEVKCQKDLRKTAKEEIKNIGIISCHTDPFQDMKITDGEFLDTVNERSLCKLCQKSRKYFCYTCYVPLPIIKEKIPFVKLPCLVDIIKHPRETDGKSTAIHAAIIAPKEVKIYTYPDIPDYDKQEDVFLVFPRKESISLEECWLKSEYTEKCSTNFPVKRVIFIDSTWNQTNKIQNDERLRDLPSLELKNRETLFWRYQVGKPRTYLATIEAIYYFARDFHTKFIGSSYKGEYDDLLFFFKFMFRKIHSIYGRENLLAYKDV